MHSQNGANAFRARGGSGGARALPALTLLHIDDDPNDTALLRAAVRKANLPLTVHNVEDGEQAIAYLSGQGIYRLDDDWHPVQAGDVIWMAPYCPQWFVAMGKSPASYIYYKDVNRDP